MVFTLAVAVTVAGAAPAPAFSCDRPVTVAEWRTGADEVEAVWARLDLEGFRAATDRLAALLPCVAEPLAVADAARAHRLAGLRADVLEDDDSAARSFLAARRLDPTWRFPSTLPEQHPLRVLYGRLPMDGGVRETLARPRSGRLLVDGEPSRGRIAGAPAIVQWLATDGSVGWTGYLPADDDTVGYPLAPAGEPVAWTLVSVAAASAIASGVSLAVAADARQDYDDPATPPSALGPLRDTTNTSYWIAVGTGAGAAGAAVAAAIAFPF